MAPGTALVVDAANVVGSRPDGWWRDRAGAAARLVSALAEALATGALDGPVVVVLEGAARAGAPATPADERGIDESGLVGAGTNEAKPVDAPTDEAKPVDARTDGPGLRVVHAPTDGDSAIVAEVSELVAGGAQPTVVTADRGLRARVEAAGATVVGPSWLRDRLPNASPGRPRPRPHPD
jgi:hypothetical protein